MRRNKISPETRGNIIRWYNEGKTVREIKELIPETPRTSIYSIIKKFVTFGSVEASPRGGPHNLKNTPEFKNQILQVLTEDCTKTLNEIRNSLPNNLRDGVSLTTIHRAIGDLNFSLKQLTISPVARNTPSAIEGRYNYSISFCELQNSFMDEEFFFLDEVGYALSIRKNRGRSLRGTEAVKRVTQVRSRNISFCVAMNINGEYFKKMSNVPFNSALFKTFLVEFIENLRIKNIIKGVIVLDNVRFHHSTIIEEYIKGTNFIILYLPPYSPFLNPIENSFSKWKSNVINMRPNTENELINCINEAVGLFEVSDFQGYWRNMTRYLTKSLLREEIDY